MEFIKNRVEVVGKMVEDHEVKEGRRNEKWRAKQRLQRAFKDAVHTVRLHHGTTPIGPALRMTGFDVMSRNKAHRDKFFNNCLKPGARLAQWRLERE